MRTEEDLRAAYTDLAGHAPDPQAMLAAFQRRTQPRRRRRLAALKASAALTAAATAAVTALAVLPGGAAPGTPGTRDLSSARDILLTAAVSAARQPASGAYWHTSVLENFRRTANGPVIASDLVNRWVASSASRESWGTEKWLKGNASLAGGLSSHHAKGSTISYGGDARSFTVFFMTVAELEHLPTSPPRLAAALQQAARRWIVTPASVRDVDSTLFQNAFDLLRAPLSPPVRAAVFRVLAQLPGVRSVGRIRDSQGRLGYGVQMSGAGWTDTLVVDLRTGAVLDDISGGYRRGHTTAAEDQTLISQGWANSIPGVRCPKQGWLQWCY
jgi:hypothetical protein